ncbi:MAG: pnp, polynucleotide phosphorylase, polyribonucleotide nucleotidyltransferase [candidate division Kazan bacterium GW2011_GWA1_50_15]|uniref:Polyribonucleotide nucleotidyltransferase n=2 Tax=Bacteria division Kazan-3B-28 TaxID=1798534 RepID=A0A0G1ZH09_UNCK3|nr:MAG: pnp, polynucleotide phosphorylase, polyribonucleotide nucleotidyltransferase [candidate division Kazan bacterium GW2011_GWA1_50_15]KKW27197.1 MAG: Polyribonucleotide nucleotidyltransferase [candidate division Kazan bacterium GW2011_GWB1_52_7]HCR42488.1 polyribonucleotide nucleotidyltransferase [Patescibacteria group bacterium]
MEQFTTQLGEAKLTLETGRLAGLANGSVTLRIGDTVVLATAVIASTPRENIDFFPLMIDYEERFYASGKISGSRFIKREGRPSEDAILSARLIDRPLRPLFPKGFYNDIQVVITVLSADLVHDPDIIAITAASAALMQAGAPFAGPVAGVRVGLISGKFVLNPTYEERAKSELDLVVAGTGDAIMMVEAGASEVAEAKMVEAIEFAHAALQPAIALQHEMVKQLNVTNGEYAIVTPPAELKTAIATRLGGKLEEAIYHPEKMVRNAKLDSLRQAIWEEFISEENPETVVADIFSKVVSEEFRKNILEQGKRPDGRKLDEIRPLQIEVGLLPRPHGSALFTRGETQALSTVTLGSLDDEQMLDTMELDTTKRYMHHYNFPPYATGEVKPMRTTGRREIGHGALAERALLPMIPSREDFPYTIRVVSEILASNGSSSMASVCGSTLSLMDAGVPITKPVAGIAMGLVTGDGKYKILTDIAGIEDFNGDMDFKVAGSHDGITALQMDIKVTGITKEIMSEALAQAREAREFLLAEMSKVIAAPRSELSPFAPRVIVVKVPQDRIGEVIGPGGRVINEIIDRAGGKGVTNISIEEDGNAFVTSSDPKLGEQAAQTIRDMMREIKPGEKFNGRVTRIMDFGAFVEVLPGREGLVHISQLANHRVEKVTDVVKEGDMLDVVVTEIDNLGRINLSHKAVSGGSGDNKR